VLSAERQEMACGRLYAGTIFLTCLTMVLTRQLFRNGRQSAISVTTISCTSVSGSTFSSLSAKLARITMALAPESRSGPFISAGVYSGLRFTMRKPARIPANIVTRYCSTLGI
jgi:hypothetical protein